jgi:hypothetical protein
MIAAIAAIVGTIIGGFLSVLASLLGQRVQSRSQWLVQEIKQRQQLYSEFIQGTVRCYADALQQNEPDPGRLANMYGEIGRMRLSSSEAVVNEAYAIVHTILQTYHDPNRNREEIRDLLNSGSVDLFSKFGDACRAELAQLSPHEPHMFGRMKPIRRSAIDAHG